ncbi:hypothetical protein BO226_19305 [Rhodococcus sp. 2G]|uniref:DUF6221 family protein n=1 Tax=Rhodococcus sp. 2G TaxID=1570939 RepID=UPI0009038D22|nr:DUF6221 family protein [Rhodococcus sp. 2G]APE11024.1 hypothetical protein BO226_18975 [Rhodococcus sp. 2G]APE11080.1 hypothetical protein BO226_19305 [Rhodococcus sp. 2G]
MTIIEFIEARIAEDEQIATKAGTGKYARWDYAGDCDSASNGEVYYPDTRTVIRHMNGHESISYDCVTCDSEGLTPSVTEEIGPHIARHDPARVLHEVEAKRKLLDLSRRWLVSRGGQDGEMSRKNALDILRLLAAPYSDHPDYQKEWA